jgi:hypothetical protein
MYRGTTPTITLKLDTDFDFNLIKEVWVTVSSMLTKITKKTNDCVLDLDSENKTVSIMLSQEETLSFVPGEVNIQVRILTINEEAFATPVNKTKFDEILEEGVISG